jgi:hypothetical protein
MSTTRRQSKFCTNNAALLFSLASLLKAPLSAATIEPLPRIVGGQNAAPGEYRFFVSWDTSCGATVIHDDIILTAAHVRKTRAWMQSLHNFHLICFACQCPSISQCNPVQSNSVTVGAFTRGEVHESQPIKSVSRSIDYRIEHPDYNKESWQMDMMLLKLHGPVPDWIPKVRLNKDNALPADGDAVTVIGMGRLDEEAKLGFPEVLQEVNVSVTDFETCNSQEMYRGFIDDPTMICASVTEGGKDACFGDSGGPLLQDMGDGNWTQVGIVSFGVGCARSNRPGVYSRVSMAYDWIQDMICEHSENKPASCPQLFRAFDKLSEAPSAVPSLAPSPAPSPAPTTSPTAQMQARDFSREKAREFKSKTRSRSLPLPEDSP